MKVKIETERLILRDLENSDATELAEQGNEKEINYFVWYIPYPFREQDAKKLIENRRKDYRKKRGIYELAIIHKESGKLMGLVSLYNIDKENNRAKIGYWLGNGYRGKGYASETIKKMIEFGFKELKLNKLSAKALASNEKSNKLLERLGFRMVGVKRKDKKNGKDYLDTVIWELLNEDD